MTRAEIFQYVRNLVNETDTDAGAKLSDSGNMLTFLEDSSENVVLDLLPYSGDLLLDSEDIDLVADQQNYSLTAEWLQITKLERLTTDKSPLPLMPIDVNEQQFFTNNSDTEATPTQWMLVGEEIYFVKTPSEAATDYARAWFLKPEITTMAAGGPTILPRVIQKLICVDMCVNIAIAFEAKTAPFEKLYNRKIRNARMLLAGRVHQKPRFVKPSFYERSQVDDRQAVLEDVDWP